MRTCIRRRPLIGVVARISYSRSYHSATRPRYFSSSRDEAIETYHVRCGSAGSITVDIHNVNLLTAPTTPLIIYLPPTGTNTRHPSTERATPLSSHELSNNETYRQLPLAQINYRWNIPPQLRSVSPRRSSTPRIAGHAFPTPLHDILHAYTWLTTSFLPSFNPSPNMDISSVRIPSPYSSISSQPISRTRPRPLLIYGSFLGGTLASSLSLTETRVRPDGVSINGVIIHNGVFDWTRAATACSSPASSPPPSVKGYGTGAGTDSLMTGQEAWDLSTLLSLRSTLFLSPASAFDVFASPLLFFRTSGLSIPPYFPGTIPPAVNDLAIGGLSPSKDEITSLHGSGSAASENGKEDEEITVSRKATLKFPPKDSGLKIPRSLFLTTSPLENAKPAQTSKKARREKGEREMHRQTEEMARLMRRSVVMHEYKERALWDESADAHAASNERVQVRELGTGKGEQAEVVREWISRLELE